MLLPTADVIIVALCTLCRTLYWHPCFVGYLSLLRYSAPDLGGVNVDGYQRFATISWNGQESWLTKLGTCHQTLVLELLRICAQKPPSPGV